MCGRGVGGREAPILRQITADNSTLRIAYGFMSNLTTASGSRLFGSVVETWIINPAAWVGFPPKLWDSFSA